MGHESDLILACAHEMSREGSLGHPIENILINLAGNVSGAEFLFDPRIQFDDVVIGVPHLLRDRTKRIRPGPIGDITGIASADIDHDRFVSFQDPPASHYRSSRVKSACTNGPIECVRISRRLAKRHRSIMHLHIETPDARYSLVAGHSQDVFDAGGKFKFRQAIAKL